MCEFMFCNHKINGIIASVVILYYIDQTKKCFMFQMFIFFLNLAYSFFFLLLAIMSFCYNENVMVTSEDVVTMYDIIVGDWLAILIFNNKSHFLFECETTKRWRKKKCPERCSYIRSSTGGKIVHIFYIYCKSSSNAIKKNKLREKKKHNTTTPSNKTEKPESKYRSES